MLLELTEESVADEARALQARYGNLEPLDIIELAIDHLFNEEIAVVSSFGAESSVLLHLIASVDRATPVLFLDTGKHFPATLRYRDDLIADLGMTDVHNIHPLQQSLKQEDPYGAMSMTDKDRCCYLRKVEPMARAVAPYRAWMTGRKQFQAATRTALPVFEAVGERIRINPLAHWNSADLKAYMIENHLPPHPLVAEGYLSIGCMPCTQPVRDGEDARSGRWVGSDKTECGIHLTGLTDQLSNISLTDSNL
ncbi:phosphoadenylyl-sulfate reductase [Phyllobacterium sp. 0TCS1.6C]|uniref:phosphoadenylyl-sulfate reductase n=1 Tax=unclassified Phyllobacterium TaxID=2638441 RepID=UPI0022641568|nr:MULTISPECIES: phosphoadenylyl-sulfate reductase [unclassified Phyllobacterium]MCX8278754.1 phosphoadenylyl-sulfate reductase [Phyllobacterium sp. 0TCS1.6C]MCX8293416.1 phosphoadenylyl-sulfate reductase [Phyllobacterium sp. 0TCS1.6A]